MLRTIYLPNDQSQLLRGEVEQLHQQVQEQRVYYERLLNTLRDERSAYEEGQRTRYLQAAEDIERALSQLQEQEVFNHQLVRDHVEQLSQFEADERRLQEETEAVRLENALLRDQIRDVAGRAEHKKQEVKGEYERSAQEYAEKFREQSRHQKENIAIIKDQYKKVQEIYRRKMADMQDKLARETKKTEVAERRRKLELDGYAADLSSMHKKIRHFQKYIAKMKKAVEEEEERAQEDLIEMSDEEEKDENENAMEEVQEEAAEEPNEMEEAYNEQALYQQA